VSAFNDVVCSEVYPMTTALCGTIGGVDTPGTTNNLRKEARSRAPQRRFALFTARMRHRLRYVGAAIASIAAVGAVIALAAAPFLPAGLPVLLALAGVLGLIRRRAPR